MNNMKKMIMILMMVFGLSVASFAETVFLMNTGTEVVFTDTTSRESQRLIEKETKHLSDDEIVELLNDTFCNVYKEKGNVLKLERYEITPTDPATEKYGLYHIMDYNGEWIAHSVSLGGGRKILMMFSIEK